MLGYEAQLICCQRLLGVDVGVSYQFQDIACFLVVMEFDFHLSVHIAEALDAAVFADRDFSAGFDKFSLTPSQLLEVIELVIPAVLESAVRMNARFMGKSIGAHAYLVNGEGNTKRIGSILGKSSMPS